MDPLYLKPVYIKTIWAGNRLRKIRNLQDGIGISREVCAYKGSENEVLNDEYKGKLISEIIQEEHDALMNDDLSNQLIRVAYIDAKDDLSIQVHPNEEYAKIEKDYEKSESWYILEADPGSTICAGVNISDKNFLKEVALNGELHKYINNISVEEGDFALIPAGMLHACGKNILALEIGSFGGITYRLYDYGRGRELHLEDGLKVLDTSLQCTINHNKLPDIPTNQINVGVDHPLFHVDVIDVAESMVLNTNGHYCVVIMVHNEGVIICDKKEYKLGYTETLVIPSNQKSFEIRGNVRVLYAYHPINNY